MEDLASWSGAALVAETIVLFTLHVNPEILRVNEKSNTEILWVKHCVLTTLLGVSNSPG